MAYDQHWGQASGEGSVASLDWVDKSIKNTLEKGIPADQLVLGIPFYSKLWNLTPTSDENSAEITYMIGFKNLGLSASKKWMNDNVSSPTWIEESGQYYGEIQKNDITYKMWLEDETSIEAKLNLMQEHKLAGAAFWSSDLDNTSIWEVIIKYIN
jgi:spore germination protein YaaH